MAVDPLPSPRLENTEASSSQGMSSVRKQFYYEESDVPDTNPDYEQEGMGRGIHFFNFNYRSDGSLTVDEMPDMRQIIKGGPSAAEHAATKATRLAAAASGIMSVTPTPIMWPMWPVEEDPMVIDHINVCKMHGREVDPHQWWCTCALTDLCLQWVMAEMLADRDSHSKEEYGVN
jgi:hypothetical protein